MFDTGSADNVPAGVSRTVNVSKAFLTLGVCGIVGFMYRKNGFVDGALMANLNQVNSMPASFSHNVRSILMAHIAGCNSIRIAFFAHR